MPSPVGHALAGLAVGVLAAGPRSLVRAIDPPAAKRPIDTAMLAMFPFACLGVLPDIDLLFGVHSMYTHSVGASALVGLLARAVTGSWRLAAAAALAYASHILLDWMGNDTTPPIGIMALWPLTSEYYESQLHVFMPISRRYWLPGFLQHNFTAVVRELLLIGPFALLAFWRLERVAHDRH
jgi:membrane-bound metal-dependent hydrolase YbcI (DUF457 family)